MTWTGARTTAGYGQRRIGGKLFYIHRLAWEEIHGPIPEGRIVCHHCDNPPCYEVDHLFLGTDRSNKADEMAKRRHNFGERNGKAKLTEAQVFAILADPRPQRVIAADYPITRSMVSHIKRGHSWRHTQPPCG